MNPYRALTRAGRMLPVSQKSPITAGKKVPFGEGRVTIWDLDETLTYARGDKEALLPPGLGQLDIEPHEWIPWERQLPFDVAEPEMAGRFRSMRAEGEPLAILTARPERVRGVTEDWLQRHDLMPDALFMRPLELENVPSGPYKRTMIERHLPRARIQHIYDDSGGVISMAEEMGIPATRITPKRIETPRASGAVRPETPDEDLMDMAKHSSARFGLRRRS